MPLPLTVSCSSQIQIGFTFLVPAHPGSPGQRAVKRVCVCVCMPIHTDSGSGIGRKGTLAPFPQRLGILQQIFKHPSYVHIDAKLPHFIQLSLTFAAAAADVDDDVPNAELHDSVGTLCCARADAVALKQQRRISVVEVACQTHVLYNTDNLLAISLWDPIY